MQKSMNAIVTSNVDDCFSKIYSCMNIYAYSCLNLLSNSPVAALKQKIHVLIREFTWRLNMVFI